MVKVTRLLLILILMNSNSLAQQSTFDFEALFDGRYKQETVEAPNWMNDGTYYSAIVYNDSLKSSELRKYSILNDKYEVLLTETELQKLNNNLPLSIDDYQFSSDESKLLIQTETEAIWRRSRLAYHFVFDFKDRSLQKVSLNDVKQSNAEFSPNADKVAFTRSNNLFIYDVTTKKETAVTNDGKWNAIINGSTDWVYEEEFSFAKAWFWSPDGKKIAFYRFDVSEVKEFFYTNWTSLNYPEQVVYKYPKAGEKNADVTIHVYDLESKNTRQLQVDEDPDHYIVRVNWTSNSSKLAVRKMNRLQNDQELLVFNVNDGSKELLKKETNENWIEGNDDLSFLKDGKSFIYVSEEDGFNHIYLYTNNGKKVKQLTKGEWDVTAIVGINEMKKVIYFVSSEESPKERHLYRVSFDGKKKTKLTKGYGVHQINMNSDQTYYLDYYSSDKQVLTVSLFDSSGKQIRVLESNKALKQILKEEPLLPKKFLSIPVQDNLRLNAWVINPPNFDSTKSYPVLMFVYGGPGSQTVMNQFASDQRSLWHQYLAYNGYIIVSVDNRGTGARGVAFKKEIYKNMGKVETEDQIAVAKYLAKKSFVDSARIGIWGWSYGGFMSTLSLERGADVFKAAIAVAPVIDWRYYDTIYTERYMQTPQLNPDGYRTASPIYEAAQIKGNYLLIHGTGDDNVHFQNAVSMADALQHYNIPFQTMFYPNRNHGIYGGETRRHLYSLMSMFIFEKL